MREEIANMVYPVIAHGMNLLDRLNRGEQPDLDREQMELKRLLGNEAPGRRPADYGADISMSQPMNSMTSTQAGGVRTAETFLGIRYALVCWLDEIFIDSPWAAAWNEQKLEAALYGTNDRAWKFWDQAKRAETQPGGDALEVFFLCVMLGFRGDLREDPTRLQAWVAGTQIRVSKSQAQEWTVPPELQPTTYVPPLRGRERMQTMVQVGGLLLLVLIPVATFLFVLSSK